MDKFTPLMILIVVVAIVYCIVKVNKEEKRQISKFFDYDKLYLMQNQNVSRLNKKQGYFHKKNRKRLLLKAKYLIDKHRFDFNNNIDDFKQLSIFDQDTKQPIINHRDKSLVEKLNRKNIVMPDEEERWNCGTFDHRDRVLESKKEKIISIFDLYYDIMAEIRVRIIKHLLTHRNLYAIINKNIH